MNEYLKDLYAQRQRYLNQVYVFDCIIEDWHKNNPQPREEYVDLYGCERSAVHSLFPVRYDSTPFS